VNEAQLRGQVRSEVQLRNEGKSGWWTKRSFGDKCVPKCNFGTRGKSGWWTKR